MMRGRGVRRGRREGKGLVGRKWMGMGAIYEYDEEGGWI
jgi:hypothetical protein